jgi:O-antigen ligase
MGPLLALFLCLVFIALFLIRDSKRRARLSAATWIPTLILFTLASRTPAQWLGQSGRNALIDQVYFAVLIAASLIILSSRAVKWSKLFVTNTATFVFYGYLAVSFLWSSYPADSFIRVVKDFGTTVVMVLVLFSEEEPLEAARAVYVRCACVAFPLSMLFTKFYTLGKEYGREGVMAFHGVAGQKNSFGEMLMVFILFLMWDHLESRPARVKWLWSRMPWDRGVLLLMGIWLLYLSQSKTSLVCSLIGLGLILTRGWLASRMISITVFCVALSLPFLLLFTHQLSSSLAPFLEVLGRDATFTGRTSIWQHMTLETVNPSIGAGFWSFWGTGSGLAVARAMAEDSGETYTPGSFVPSAHNGYLDIYLDGGFIGLALLLFLLTAGAKRIIGGLPWKNFHRLRFAFLVVAIVSNLTESFFARPGPLWFTTVLILINYPFRETRVSNPKPTRPGARTAAAAFSGSAG